MFALVLVIIVSLFMLWRDNGFRLFSEPGTLFEERVARNLHVFEKNGGKVLQDCYFRWRNGSTVQIDCMLICQSGIYVVECKDYKGWVFGNDVNDRWTVAYYAGRFKSSERHSFYNPIKQNNGHIKYVASRTIDMNIPIHSLIVFSRKCTLKNITNNSDSYVIYEWALNHTIRNIDLSVGSVLSQDQINKLYYRFQKYNEADDEIKIEHSRNVHIAKNTRKEKAQNNNCPICDGHLVIRNGRYGRFYGCSNYPDCSFTKCR